MTTFETDLKVEEKFNSTTGARMSERSKQFKKTFEMFLMCRVGIKLSEFEDMLAAIGWYNEFDPVEVYKNLNTLIPPDSTESDFQIEVGREYSPVIYLKKYLSIGDNAEMIKTAWQYAATKSKADEFSCTLLPCEKPYLAEARFWWD